MNITLIRHGETEANIKTDAAQILTAKGKKQIATLAKRLKNSKLDAIYSSTLERASLTAKEIHKFNKQVQLIETDELQEIYLLIVGGPRKEGIRQNRFKDDLKRAEKFWKTMLTWKYENVAVVCHGNIIRFFLSKAIGASPESFWKMNIDQTSVSVITIKNKESRICSVNDVGHLSKSLLSQIS